MGMTATQLGQIFERGAASMNVLLKDHGFIEGDPGAWRPTELGRMFAQAHDFDNGYGGFAHRSWGWISWDPKLVDVLKASVQANPEGVVTLTQDVAGVAMTAPVTGGVGQAFGKNKLVALAAVGVVAAAAPMARTVWIHFAEQRSIARREGLAALSGDTAMDDSAGESGSVEDPAAKSPDGETGAGAESPSTTNTPTGSSPE